MSSGCSRNHSRQKHDFINYNLLIFTGKQEEYNRIYHSINKSIQTDIMEESQNNELAKGVGIAAEKALDFIEKLIAGPFMEGTGIFTDKVKYWRFKNQVDIITKARQYLKSKGINTPKKVSIKDVTTLLEYASFEDDEIMQESWAKLLSNAMNPNNQFNSNTIFIQILNQLSVNEVYILNFIYNNSFIMSSGHRPYYDRKELERNGRTDLATKTLLIDNLLRHRLIEEEPPKLQEELKKRSNTYDYIEEDELYSVIIPSDKFRFSHFGVELARQIFE